MMRILTIACLLALAIAPFAARGDIVLNSSAQTNDGAQSVYSPGIDGSLATAPLNDSIFDSVTGQTMLFSGTSTASAEYGALHSSSSASITNNVTFPNNGTGFNGNTYGNAEFEDTLNFAGGIPGGDHVQYYFIISGTISHTGNQSGTLSGALAQIDLSVNDNYGVGKVYDGGSPTAGSTTKTINDLWKPDVVDLDGTFSEDVDLTLESEVVVSSTQNVNGNSFSYAATFQDTLTLASVDIVDDNGVSLDPALWSVSSASGTVYAQGITAAPVPEPATLGVALFAALALMPRSRRVRQSR